MTAVARPNSREERSGETSALPFPTPQKLPGDSNPLFFPLLLPPRSVPTARAGPQPISLHRCVAPTAASRELPAGGGKPPAAVGGMAGGGFLPPPFAARVRASPDPSTSIPHSSKLPLDPFRSWAGSDPARGRRRGARDGCAPHLAAPLLPAGLAAGNAPNLLSPLPPRLCPCPHRRQKCWQPRAAAAGPGRRRRCVRRCRGQTAAGASAV